MAVLSPCYKCEDRTVYPAPNCHTDCERYLAFTADNERKREESRRQSELDRQASEYRPGKKRAPNLEHSSTSNRIRRR